mmetsp:Transcript_37330/g.93676  ORF Transcript_37330/g.93676 Transcript_37330/m.93676 type:complete len:228 (+) Transcript_37330:1050-1733(+)
MLHIRRTYLLGCHRLLEPLLLSTQLLDYLPDGLYFTLRTGNLTPRTLLLLSVFLQSTYLPREFLHVGLLACDARLQRILLLQVFLVAQLRGRLLGRTIARILQPCLQRRLHLLIVSLESSVLLRVVVLARHVEGIGLLQTHPLLATQRRRQGRRGRQWRCFAAAMGALLLDVRHTERVLTVIQLFGVLAELDEPLQGGQEGWPRVGRTHVEQRRLADGVRVPDVSEE